MILLFYGPDSYRRKQKTDEVVAAYRLKHGGLGIGKFDLADNLDDFEKAVEFLKNQSLFDPLKIAVMNNFSGTVFKTFKKIKDLKEFTALYKDSKNTIIFSSDAKPGADFKFFFDKEIKTQEFPELQEDKLLQFIKNESVKIGLELSNEQMILLKDNFGPDTWGLATELDKIGLMKDIAVARETKLPEYFQTLNIFKFGKTLNHKLWALEILLSGLREDPARIFNSLSYGRFPMDQKKWLITLADYDISVKSGKLDYEEVLTDLAIS